jgi:uncharacterized membrane protein
MEKEFKVTTRFRELLKQELETWQREDILNSEQTAAISQRYDLKQLGKETSNRLIFAIYMLGTSLVGAGMISFVAAHWTAFPAAVKIVLIISLMLACHMSGYWLWQVSGKAIKLGHALVVLGTLVFGANIGLLAQIFHIKSHFYNGLFAWALGAIIMAYAIQSVPNAVVAIVVSFAAFWGWTFDWNSTSEINMFFFYPYVATVAFLPFAWLQKSKLIAVLSLIAIGLSAMFYSGNITDKFWPVLLASLSIGLLYFGAGLLAEQVKSLGIFATAAKKLGIIFTTFAVYIFSFEWVVKEIMRNKIENWNWLFMVCSFFALSIIIWIAAFKSVLNGNHKSIAWSILLSTLLVIITILIVGINDDVSIIASINMSCLVLAAGLIRNSFELENRGMFWAGILFVTLIITSRFLEYETDLLIKAAIFTACGIALIVAGVGFENYLKKRRLENE